MKLAEALALRADSHKRIEQLKQRLLQNALVQEGDKPAENPDTLLKEVERLSDELTRLVQRINYTNVVTELEKGQSLSDALAIRDMLKVKHGIYRDLAHTAANFRSRHTASEIKFVSTVNVANLQQQADQFAKDYRELDTRIQAANWTIDLVE